MNKLIIYFMALILVVTSFSTAIVSHQAEEITPGLFGELYSGDWSFINGNVGIGTTSPNATLDIEISELIEDIPTTTQYWKSGNPGFNLKLDTLWTTSGINYNFIQKYNSVDYDVLSFYEGNVGIGTASPGAKLQIQDGDIKLASITSNNKQLIMYQPDVHRFGKIGITNESGTGAGHALTLVVEANNSYGIDYSQRVLFKTAGSERMVIEHDGNVGIGTTEPLETFDVSGTSNFQDTIKLANGSAGKITWSDGYGQGTTRIDYYNNSWTLRDYSNYEAIFVGTNGNVGIGTTNPSVKLEIGGNSPLLFTTNGSYGAAISSNTNASALLLSGGTGNTDGPAIELYGGNHSLLPGRIYMNYGGYNTTIGSFNLRFYDGAVFNDVFHANYDGNVGIGTTTPSVNLEVVGSSGQGTIRVLGDGDSKYPQFSLKRINASTDTNKEQLIFLQTDGSLNFKDNSAGVNRLAIDGNTGNINIGPSEHAPNRLHVQGNSSFVGNVGIGTTSPTEKLHLSSGNLSLTDVASVSTTQGFLKFSAPGYTNYFGGITGVTPSGAVDQINLAFYTSGNSGVPTEHMRISTDGNVGIGTINPVVKLDIEDGDVSINNGRAFYSFSKGRIGEDNASWAAFYNSNTYGTMLLSGGRGNYSNYIPDISFAKYDGSILTKLMVINTTSGNVGIGTTNPWAKLTIAETTKTSLYVSQSSNDYPAAEFYNGGGSGAGIAIRAGSGSTSFPLNVSRSDGTFLFGVNGYGNIGIGTTTPSAKLDVEVSSNGAATIGSNLNNASGDYAIALGDQTTASGDASIAMGLGTIASGPYSTTMGAGTNASGFFSMATGYMTTATGDYSTAMGSNTDATGTSSTAMGNNIETDAQYSFGIGLSSTQYTITQNNAMAIMGGYVGIGTTTPSSRLQVNGAIQVGDGASQEGIIMTSPDGTEYCCTVANGGAFSCVSGTC